MVFKIKQWIRSARTKVMRRLGLAKQDWSGGLADEGQFWDMALQDGGRNWDESEYRRRTDVHRELQDELKALIQAPAGAGVRILDVGAGPLTTLGCRWAGRQLEIIAIDPLAERYRELLQKLRITPPVVTRFGHGEKLLEYFEPDSFDLVYASNSLDHSYDPMLAISQMLKVVKRGRYLYLWHFANEGLEQAYTGLHQWNFARCEGDFIISDGRRSLSLARELEGRAEVQCESTTGYGKEVVIARIRRL